MLYALPLHRDSLKKACPIYIGIEHWSEINIHFYREKREVLAGNHYSERDILQRQYNEKGNCND